MRVTSGQVKTSKFQLVLPCPLRVVGFGLNFPLSLTPGRGRRVTVGAEDWQEGGWAVPPDPLGLPSIVECPLSFLRGRCAVPRAGGGFL